MTAYERALSNAMAHKTAPAATLKMPNYPPMSNISCTINRLCRSLTYLEPLLWFVWLAWVLFRLTSNATYIYAHYRLPPNRLGEYEARGMHERGGGDGWILEVKTAAYFVNSKLLARGICWSDGRSTHVARH